MTTPLYGQMMDVPLTVSVADPAPFPVGQTISFSASATDISPRIGLSVSQMARLFKREMGISIVEYRNDLKMRRFFQLVQGNRRPSLWLTALTAGFRSYAQFHKVFRARWRVGPREFFGRQVKTSLSA